MGIKSQREDNGDEREEPAYSLVQDRIFVPLVGIEELIKPSFVFLKSNDNPALALFAAFVASLG